MVKKGIITLAGLGVLFILLGRLLGLSEGRLERATSLIVYPFLKAQQAVMKPISSWSYKRRVKNNLLTEYEQLVQQRDELHKQVVALKGLAHDQQAAEELRLYSERFSTKPIIAPILLKNFSSSQFLLLDAGTAAGIEVGMIAVYTNCLVGKVTETYPLYSKVLLIADPTCKVSVYCSSNGVKGIHTGQKKGHVTLEYVDHRDTVTEEDLVLSSGLGGVFPRGFCVGKVAQVDSTPYGRSIIVSPCIDVQGLDYVCVIPTTGKS